METLVVVAQQEQFHSRNRGRNHGSFNCRTFESGSGILPSPVTKHSLPNSPKTPYQTSSNVKKHVYSDQNVKHIKRISKTRSVPIPLDVNVNINVKPVDCYSRKDNSLKDSLNDGLFYSELWAGPAYSNSPPPSSLPIPKFSVKPKRTVSLELPVTVSEIDVFAHVAKSAPPSPAREHHKCSRREFVNSDDEDEFATKTLRRILNLDLADE